MPNVLRIIDANANRARESLRVMEEAARFLCDDRELTESLKTLRHDFTIAIRRLEGLELSRDTPGDVGTTISTPAERARSGAADVVIAAGKRLSEALRAIEEYGKTLDAEFAQEIERLRYRGYELERRLHVLLAGGLARQWRLCLVLSESSCLRPWREVVEAAIDNGCDCIQLREKAIDDDARLLARAQELISIARRRDPAVSVVINDRVDVALLAGADGAHLGQADLPPQKVRDLAGRRLLIGVSTSTLEQAKEAHAAGADYCGVGPMFATTTKRKERIVGPAYLREYLAWGRLPHLAIGGVSPDNVHALVEAGCRGAAVSSAICAAEDPGAAAAAIVGALEERSDVSDQRSVIESQ